MDGPEHKDPALSGPSLSVRSAAARQTMVRVCHLPRPSSGLPPSYAAFVLFRQPSSRFPAVGEKDAQPVTAEKENKNMKFSSNNNSNSGSGGQKEIRRQQTTTQQIIAENVKHLIEQLEQGKSEALTAYLTAMARFHNYSFGNILSIAHHRPDATHVAGIRTWNEFGRFVKKGQKGIPILAPMIGTKRQRDEQPVEQSDKPRPLLIGFRIVYVFDIAQTDGKELPEPATVSGEVGTHHDRLFEFVQQQGIELEYNERIAPAQGVSYGGRIVLLPGQTKAEEFSTLVHELAHLCCVKNYVVIRCSVLS